MKSCHKSITRGDIRHDRSAYIRKFSTSSHEDMHFLSYGRRRTILDRHVASHGKLFMKNVSVIFKSIHS